ncbi:DUF4249 domain-containing protein [Pedobacter frigiditerrae]|uniref:DUF4249 domain-containing protein n=1 Tax=Pedobacter frigiditerrae TaxID=2530452 RepID=A0A4R0MTS0_9SPHI|nr:DUF4249 domain-containing protein [Pedobacter frigiditerrae]TCC90465.1 DUF4249 domain-containing protein [Pedobacter frigiditerrae]
MNNIFKKQLILSVLIVTVLFTSCEKVIDLKLNNTEPKLVIEAILIDLDVKHIVSITKTVNFDASNDKVPVSNAIVAIKEENGPTIVYTEQTPGNYISSKYKAIPGKKYTMSVIVNGQTYVATSIMPLAVPIKSLSQIELSAFGETRKIVQVNYNDPAGIANFYYNRVFINNLKKERYYVESDRFNDGREVKNNIFIDEPNLVTGDKVKVQLLTIDANVYKYLFSITQITGNGGPPTTPANPESNFNNGALGFFSASSFTVDSLVIK